MNEEASGFETNFVDPGTGIELPTAWIQLRNLLYVPYNYVFMVVDIYKDQASYEAGKSAVFSNIQNSVSVGSADWTNYFDPSIMRQADHDFQSQCLSWVQNNTNLLQKRND